MSNTYWCSYCKSYLEKEKFYACKSRSTGVTAGCKECSRKRAREWAIRNKARALEICLKYSNTESAKSKKKQWRENNKDMLREYAADWRKKNKEALAGKGISSYYSLPTPAWADKSEIKALYKKAKSMSKDTGIRYEVDHVIPLRGKTVCGLHVETNLRIVTKEENMKKLNRLLECEAAA